MQFRHAHIFSGQGFSYHVHPSAVRMAFRLFPERICLVSDALRCCGMPEGAYELGGRLIEE